jgi:hypothetical protein
VETTPLKRTTTRSSVMGTRASEPLADHLHPAALLTYSSTIVTELAPINPDPVAIRGNLSRILASPPSVVWVGGPHQEARFSNEAGRIREEDPDVLALRLRRLGLPEDLTAWENDPDLDGSDPLNPTSRESVEFAIQSTAERPSLRLVVPKSASSRVDIRIEMASDLRRWVDATSTLKLQAITERGHVYAVKNPSRQGHLHFRLVRNL